jgi:hypothetical protein
MTDGNYIIRERIDLHFAQVPKTALRDKKLSLKAKGLYAYLFSLPEDTRRSSDLHCLKIGKFIRLKL